MFKKNINYIFRKARNPFKALRIFFKKKLGLLGEPVIIPYNAFGDDEKVVITGGVIEDKGISDPQEGQNLWKNFLATVRRYSGDEIAGVRVRIEYGDISEVVRTDDRGLFHTIIPTGKPQGENHEWPSVRYTLLDDITEEGRTVTAESKIRIIGKEEKFLIVSDIDDTILVSHSTHSMKKLRLMLFKNALTRSPVTGVSDFYQALSNPGNDNSRPIFYVSGSEWNLYDLLIDFLKYQKIPRGTLLLSDSKLSLFRIWQSGKRYREKITIIKGLFELYHNHDFILIGDSGQKDPEIYLRMAEMYASRIKAVYIRDIGIRKKQKRLQQIIHDAGELGVDMIIAASMEEAAKHAAAKGFTEPPKAADIREESSHSR